MAHTVFISILASKSYRNSYVLTPASKVTLGQRNNASRCVARTRLAGLAKLSVNSPRVNVQSRQLANAKVNVILNIPNSTSQFIVSQHFIFRSLPRIYSGI
jgi:hypothetical protein